MIKYSVILVLVAAMLSSCNSLTGGYTISGEVKNAAGEMIYLDELTKVANQPVDSIKLDDSGEFKFKGKSETPKFCLIRNSKNEYIMLIVHPGESVEIKTDMKSFAQGYELDGSDDSRFIKDMNDRLAQVHDQIRQLGQVYNESKGTPQFDSIQADVEQKYSAAFESHKQWVSEQLTKNPSSLAGIVALYQQITPHNYFFDPMEDFKYYKMIDSAIYTKYPDNVQAQVLHEFVEQSKVQQQYEAQSVEVGTVAPEIALPDPHGDTLTLTSLRGKYVLLDFWAGWCPPCRQENPNLVKTYQKFKEKGFEILQVSLDKTREEWLAAIEQDNLGGWKHISDLKYWQSVPAQVYNVKGIPSNFLLDREGKVVARNLKGEALDETLSKILIEQ